MRLFFAALITIMLCVIGTSLWVLNDRHSSLRGPVQESGVWAVLQYERALRKFQYALSSLALNPTSMEAAAEVTLRYDLLYSRINIIDSGEIAELLDRDAERAAAMAASRESILKMEPEINRLGNFDNRAKVTDLIERTEALARKSELMLLELNADWSEEAVHARQETLSLYGYLAGAFAILAVTGIGFIALLGRLLSTSESSRLREKTLSDELATALEQAKGVSQAKSVFLANMSHELRTPLNAIIGFSSAIHDKLFGPIGHPKYEEYLADIQFSARHLLRLINDILDLSAIEAGKLKLDDNAVPIKPLVAQAIMLVRAESVSRSITIDDEVEADLPVIRGDERRLTQVLVNLMVNAMKFSDAGSTVTLLARRSFEGDLVVEVRDQGEGMSEEDIANALREFAQVSNDAVRRSQGAGLGLPLALAICELHGGRLELESLKGKGTTARIRIPKGRLMENVVEPAA